MCVLFLMANYCAKIDIKSPFTPESPNNQSSYLNRDLNHKSVEQQLKELQEDYEFVQARLSSLETAVFGDKKIVQLGSPKKVSFILLLF